MELNLILLALGVVALVGAALLRADVGNVLALVGLVLAVAGAFWSLGHLTNDKLDRLADQDPTARAEISRNIPF